MGFHRMLMDCNGICVSGFNIGFVLGCQWDLSSKRTSDHVHGELMSS